MSAVELMLPAANHHDDYGGDGYHDHAQQYQLS
jgi:hypothetical protein